MLKIYLSAVTTESVILKQIERLFRQGGCTIVPNTTDADVTVTVSAPNLPTPTGGYIVNVGGSATQNAFGHNSTVNNDSRQTNIHGNVNGENLNFSGNQTVTTSTTVQASIFHPQTTLAARIQDELKRHADFVQSTLVSTSAPQPTAATLQELVHELLWEITRPTPNNYKTTLKANNLLQATSTLAGTPPATTAAVNRLLYYIQTL
jgi:hypothetical protein